VLRRQFYIGQLELLAAPAPYCSLPPRALERLRGRNVIHFIDNTSAQAGLVKGYARALDSARIVNAFHAVAAVDLGCNVYFEYVPSAANVADGPSRGDLDYLIHTLGSHIVGTVLPDVAEWRAPPAAWMDGAWRLDGRRTLEPNVRVLNVHRPQSLQTGTVRLHILRPHPLSNPFPMRGFSVRERAAVVAAFEFSWEHPEEPLCDVARRFGVGLSDRVPPLSARTAAFRLLVEAARCAPIALFCVCAPEPCHGDVVARMVYRAVAETAPEPLGSQSRPRRRKRPRASGTAGGEARIGPGP
jgi:hypothetical protein